MKEKRLVITPHLALVKDQVNRLNSVEIKSVVVKKIWRLNEPPYLIKHRVNP
jgi:superfamily II DNA helicase RecQ